MFYSSLTALIIHPFYISFLFLHKPLGLMARNGLLCADVPLRNYSINQKRYLVDSEVFLNFIFQSLRASFVTVRATHYMA